MFKLFANSQVQTDSAERIPVSGSGVLSATGLSRNALRQYVGQNGLFGRDSVLEGIEQAVVQSVLGPVAQINAGAVGDLKGGLGTVWTSHLRALRAFSKAALQGEGSVSRVEWNQAGDAGLSVAKRYEVQTVVGLLKESFGLSRSANGEVPSDGRAANETTIALAHAA
jgi:hypothetical protein